MKSTREYELEIKNLKDSLLKKEKEITSLKKTSKIQSKLLKQKDELLKDLLRENKTEEYKRKYLISKDEIKRLTRELEAINAIVEDLKTRINKNSSNSSKPSSTDGFKKQIHNFREKTARLTGGQKGHKGVTIKQKESPTEIVEKKAGKCSCGGNVTSSDMYTRKQIVDVEIRTICKEERVYKGVCDKCGKAHTGSFSKEFVNPVQYGQNIKTLVGLLLNEGYLSLNRCQSFFKEISQGEIQLSEGTLVKINSEISQKGKKEIEKIKNKLLESEVAHSDETGVRVCGKQGWLHTLCNEWYVYYEVHKKRGTEALDEMELLKVFTGILVHDHFKPYYKYKQITQAECNAHILRYLKGFIEIFHRKETEDFIEYMVELNNRKKEAIRQGKKNFSKKEIEQIETEYKRKLEAWKKAYYQYITGKKVNETLNDERCLFERLLKYSEEHLRFITNFKVPFDNNMAERALRMIKTKKNVSGGFRSERGAEDFANIRSLIGSAKKQGKNLYNYMLEIISSPICEN